LPEAFIDTFEEYVLRGDEIVLVMVGATVGKLGRVPAAACPALLNQNMWTLNAKAPFTHDLLWHLAHVLIEAKVHDAQGGAYSFLTKKDFLQHRVGRFDHDAMAERVSYLSAIEAHIQRLAEELRAAIAMKATLSADLLSGHVRVPA
jgi:type I restriction enzyme S subunit